MRLFTYGTLKKGFRNHELLKNANYIGDAFIYGRMINTNYGFPALITGTDIVKGELYEIDIFTLESLDWLEQEGYMYTRTMERIEGHSTFVYWWRLEQRKNQKTVEANERCEVEWL